MTDSEPLEDAIFLAARDIADPIEQRTYLEKACRTHPGLQTRVERLLALRPEADALLERRDVPDGLFDLRVTGLDGGGEHPGQWIGRYKLLEPLGQGGFGAVWMAEQREPVRRRVALKIIKLGMDTKQVIARFERERQALALMDHPGITKVFDAGVTDSGRPYFVMELVRGVPFLDYCDAEKLVANRRLELFIQVCQAVQHAHQKGVIHRDIKPSNILITLQDGKPIPKVIDFGIAKATGAELTEKTLFTQYGEMIGTPTYMSPEQAQMLGPDIDTRSDVYSQGVLLYELLTGATPLDREQLLAAGYTDMVRMIREQEPPRPSTRISMLGLRVSAVAAQRRTSPERLGVLLRGDLDAIVMKALEKDRDRRYDTAQGFANDVARYLHDEPVEARAASSAYLLFKTVRRHRHVALAGLAFILTILAGLTATGIAWQSERRTREEITHLAIGQALQLAYGAFENRLDELARQLLDRHVPEADSARSLAWGFLDQRLKERQPNVLFELAEPIECIALDPLGQIYAIGSVSGDILLVDRGGAILDRWIGDRGTIMDVDFSRDGTLLAAACLNGCSILFRVNRDPLAQLSIEQIARVEHPVPASAVAILDDRERVVSLLSRGVVNTWDFTGNLDASSPTAWHPSVEAQRCFMSVSRDGNRLATYGWDGAVMIHSVDTLSGKPLPPMNLSFEGRVRFAGFIPEGARLVTGSMAGTQVWDVGGSTPARLYDLSWRQTEQGLFSTDDMLFAAEQFSTGLSVFHFTSGRVIARFALPHRQLELDERRLRLAALEPGQLIFAMRRVSDGEPVEGSVIAAYSIPQEDHAWTATPAWWDPPMAVHPFEPIVACPDPTQRIKLWNVETGTIEHLAGDGALRSNTITAMAFSSHGERLAVARGEWAKDEPHKQVTIWDMKRREPIIELDDVGGGVNRVVFSPIDPDHLVTTGARREAVRLWNLSDQTSRQLKADVDGHLIGVDFSGNGEILALGGPAWAEGRSRPAEFWDVADWSRPRLLNTLEGTDYTQAVAGWPHAKRFAFLPALTEPVIAVWDVGAKAPSTITLSGGRIHSLALVEGGRLMVAAGAGTLRFIDASRGEEIASFAVEHELRIVHLMPAYRRLVASTSGGRILQWRY